MPDILDKIIEMLPPSTLDLILRWDEGFSQLGKDLDHILKETQAICVTQITNELNVENSKAEVKVEENVKLLNKFSKEIEHYQSIISNNDCQQIVESQRKKLVDYEIQIKEIEKKFGNVDGVKLFIDIENLYKEKEELEKNITKLKSTYECFEGIPPSIDGAKKAIKEIKERIQRNEKEVEGLY